MTWHNSNHITLPHAPDTEAHHVIISQHVASPPRNGWGLIDNKNLVCGMTSDHMTANHMTSLYIRAHDSIWLHVAWHSRTKTKTKKLHHKMTWHEITWQHLTSQVANNHSNSPQITSQLATSLQSSKHKHITSKHMTSQPRNGKSFVDTRKMFWASQ